MGASGVSTGRTVTDGGQSERPHAAPWHVGRGVRAPRDLAVVPHRHDGRVASDGTRTGRSFPWSRENMTIRNRTLLLAVAGLLSLPVSGVLADDDGIEFLNSGKVLPTNLPFSEAVRVGNTLYLSGQIGIVPGGMPEEAKQTMENIRISLEAHGYQLSDVVKCTVMLADIAEWGSFNQVYRTYFTDRFPARSALGASGLALGARVEVECIAAKAD